MLKRIKQNPLIRGIYELYKQYLSIRKRQFGYIGKDVLLIPPLSISNPKNVFLFDNTKLTSAVILATNARFVMKRNSAAAEGLKVSTGAHKLELGKFYRTVQKSAEEIKFFDKDVVIEEDVWIGMNVIITAGVTVGRGSTVGAGAVLTKNVPPYSLVAGVPARIIKFKWTIEQIIEHEKMIYDKSERIRIEQLEENFRKYQKI